MRDFLLPIMLLPVFAFGQVLMGKLDAFLEEIYEAQIRQIKTVDESEQINRKSVL